MHLVIDTAGSYLRVKEAKFLVKNKDKVFKVPAASESRSAGLEVRIYCGSK